jgi:hypothetical protein
MKWTEKLGNYLIDVSKYILIGIFVASIFKDIEGTRVWVYALSGSVSILLLYLGIRLCNLKKKE